MKGKTLIFIAVFILQILSANAQDLEYGIVEYVDSVASTFKERSVRHANKIAKTSFAQLGTLWSRQGKIQASYEDSYFMTEGVKHCLRMAMDTWEAAIEIKNPIQFYVCVSEDLPDEIAIQTTVGYVLKSRFNSLPDNLYLQDNNGVSAKDTIRINAMLDWNSSWPYDDTYAGTDNMTNGFLRHIAHILGFGTSLVNRSGGVGFAINRAPSPYDNYNGQKFLADLKLASSSQLKGFCNHSLSLKSSDFDYKLFNTSVFVQNKTGNYFSLGYSNIMEYPVLDSATLLDINEESLNVMAAIGWEVISHNKKIASSNTDILGYGSIYDKHSFYLTHNQTSNVIWQCQALNLATNSYETLYSKTSEKLDAISLGILEKSIDSLGCLNYRILCKDGNASYVLPLALDVRPKIEDVVVSNVNISASFCEYDLGVTQRGAREGSVLVSDDSGAVTEYKYNEST